MAKKQLKSHDCFKLVNEELKEQNAELDLRMRIDFKSKQMAPPALPVALVKLDSKKRKPLPTLISSFCPFCGEKLL